MIAVFWGGGWRVTNGRSLYQVRGGIARRGQPLLEVRAGVRTFAPKSMAGPVPAGPSTAEPALEAEVIEDAAVDQLAAATPLAVAAQVQPMPMTAVPAHPPVAARVVAPPKVSTADFIDAQRASLTAMGGTAAAFVLGVFALGIGLFGFWGAPSPCWVSSWAFGAFTRPAAAGRWRRCWSAAWQSASVPTRATAALLPNPEEPPVPAGGRQQPILAALT